MKQPPAQPRAAFSTAVDLDTEEGRAFLQERLAFFSKVGFFLTSGFYCVGYLSFLLALPVADFLRGFGLVRDLEAARDASLTGLNTIAGTPLYLAPEAITDPDQVDARSDLYALGAVGYFMLTGRPVFEGATLIEVCSHHLHTRPVPPSRRLGRPLPAKLESLVMACLEKDPGRRPQAAQALAEELLACDDGGTWSEPEARAWWTGYRDRLPGLHAATPRAGRP